MHTLKFKTNINCESCLRAITPFIQGDKRIKEWHVDTESPEKILTVNGDIAPEDVKHIIEEAGYDAKQIN